jgi:hypothetical protein
MLLLQFPFAPTEVRDPHLVVGFSVFECLFRFVQLVARRTGFCMGLHFLLGVTF